MAKTATAIKLSPLASLSQNWLKAKHAEDDARIHRIALEEEIEALIPCPMEGSASVVEGGLKVTVTHKLTRTVDMEAYGEHCDGIPTEITPIRMKYDVDIKIYRALESGNPEMFKIVQKFVEVKPAKTAIKVEVIG